MKSPKVSSTDLKDYKKQSFEIISCYDSHVHWLMTGEKKTFLDLEKFKDISQIQTDHIHKTQFKGDWLMGFGWHDAHFMGEKPHFTAIDRISKTFPICFIKKDAHSCILNSLGLKLFLEKFADNSEALKFLEKDDQGQPTGVLKEGTFYLLFSILPPTSDENIKNYLLKGQEYFLSKGITHIRDMTCSLKQWQAITELEQQELIKIYVEVLFNIENLNDLKESILPFLKKQNSIPMKHIQIQGVKLFVDGSLGSETAFISEPYLNSHSVGYKLWNEEDLKEALRLIWGQGLQVSIHTLGDESVKYVIQIVRELQKEKVTGVLHLEHLELLSTETIQLMKSLHVRCHMQPCHWLSDKKWIDSKLSAKLKKNLFRWEALRKAKVPLFFGSDSPIEEADIYSNLQALEESQHQGVEGLNDDYLKYFSHPTNKNGKSFFSGGKVQRILLDEKEIFKI